MVVVEGVVDVFDMGNYGGVNNRHPQKIEENGVFQGNIKSLL